MPTILTTQHRPRKESYSVTALVALDEETPVVISTPRNESNTQYDFLDFILYLITNNYLVAGDKLVLDNASVHGGKETEPLLTSLLQLAQIELVYLPTYSPELNPCEFVFSQTKRHLRENRTEKSLYEELIISFFKMTAMNIARYYHKCFVDFNPI